MNSAIRLSLFGFAIACLPTLSAGAVRLTESADDDRPFSVRCRMKVNGTLQTATQGGKAIGLTMSVDAKLSFLERRLQVGGKDAASLRSLRHYDLAEANIDIGGRKTVNRLNDQLKLIVAEGQVNGIRRYSPTAQLDYDSLELLRTPGDSLAIIGLLPEKAVDVNSTWEPAAWVLPMLAGVDAVSESKLTCSIEKIDQQYAVIKIVGNLQGAMLGALTKISVEGQVAYDLKNKHIRQARIVQREERAVGTVSPGMKITATMYIDKQASGVKGRLTDQTLSSIPINASDQQLALKFISPWNIEFSFDRKWHIFHQNSDVGVLRLVEAGSLVAQCNVTPIQPAAAGKHTSERQFQFDIQKALGNQFKQITSAQQLKTNDGRFIYRVIAVGQSRNIEMIWLYYLCAAPDGSQAALVFSVESKLLEKLGKRDLAIVQSLTFRSMRTASQTGPPRPKER
jgi:hypothetical protein